MNYLNQQFHLFGVLRRFQHCTGHITTGSWEGRGNQYIQLVSRFCTVNCWPTASNYQLSHLTLCREPNPGLRGGRRECYHSATMAPFRSTDMLKSIKSHKNRSRHIYQPKNLSHKTGPNRYIWSTRKKMNVSAKNLSQIAIKIDRNAHRYHSFKFYANNVCQH